ncbi:MAG: hypothetical protein EBV45_05470 [Chloroflexi bacterium]|nr:hypothetical protein [Pseudomonadota bacterium]NCV21384.1 hypothetical protein [Chloroflexota bacterium]NDF38869.1 hypothetical protein [Pseudomonadota bacterium]
MPEFLARAYTAGALSWGATGATVIRGPLRGHGLVVVRRVRHEFHANRNKGNVAMAVLQADMRSVPRRHFHSAPNDFQWTEGTFPVSSTS